MKTCFTSYLVINAFALVWNDKIRVQWAFWPSRLFSTNYNNCFYNHKNEIKRR